MSIVTIYLINTINKKKYIYFFFGLACFAFLSTCICFSFWFNLDDAWLCFSSVNFVAPKLFTNFFRSSLRTASPHPWISGIPCVVQNRLLQYLQCIAKSTVLVLHLVNEQVLSSFLTLVSTVSRFSEAVASFKFCSLFFICFSVKVTVAIVFTLISIDHFNKHWFNFTNANVLNYNQTRTWKMLLLHLVWQFWFLFNHAEFWDCNETV